MEQFKLLPREGRTPEGYRLATVDEVKANFRMLQTQGLLASPRDGIRFLDGFLVLEIIRDYYSPPLTHMLVAKTESSGSDLYSGIILNEQGREVALQLSLDDNNNDVIQWVLSTASKKEMELAEMHLERKNETLVDYALRQENEEFQMLIFEFLQKNSWPTPLILRGITALHVACFHGLERICKFLLVKGVRPDKKDYTGQTPLHSVVRGTQKEQVLDLLLEESVQQSVEKMASLIKDDNGKTALHCAAELEDETTAVSLAKLLFENWAFPLDKTELARACDKDGRTALHIASFRGHAQLCDLLVRQHAIVDARDHAGQIPLHSVFEGAQNEEVFNLLVESLTLDIEVLNSRSQSGKTILEAACASGNPRMVKKLLDLGAQAPTAGADGKTILHYTAELKDEDKATEIATLLLERAAFGGPLATACDKAGTTALHVAIIRGHGGKLIDFLLYVQAIVHAKNILMEPQDLTPIGQDRNIQKMLISSRDWHGQTSLHMAAGAGNTRAVIQLLSKFRDPRVYVRKKALSGQTALHKAAIGGHAEIDERTVTDIALKLLYIGCQSPGERSLLLWAAAPGIDGNKNLLRTAAKMGSIDMTWELLKRGGDISDIESEKQGRGVFAEGLAAFFLHPLGKSAITVGISGEWGSGKSSLMTEIFPLKMAAQAALPKFQFEDIPGARKRELSHKGRFKYFKLQKGVAQLLTTTFNDSDEKVGDPITVLPDNYRDEYLDVLKSLARMDRNELFGTSGDRTGATVPAILTVRYDAWHYRNESEAWAGLAVEITKEMETSMSMAQKLRACWKYAWRTERVSLWIELLIPCLLVVTLVGWITWAVWLLVSRLKNKELAQLKYGSIPVTVFSMVWVLLTRIIAVVKPISNRIEGYMHLPDHTMRLGYQQKVISDIKFLKEEIGRKPSPFWTIISGEWCWNWFRLYNNNIKDTAIPKMTTASADNLRIIVFVDDLDRCQETVILQVLSAIHLVLAACEINVILGMDRHMIERAIAHSLGNGMNERATDLKAEMKDLADKYIRKIIQLPLSLPQPSHKSMEQFLGAQMGGMEMSLIADDSDKDDLGDEDHLGHAPRQFDGSQVQNDEAIEEEQMPGAESLSKFFQTLLLPRYTRMEVEAMHDLARLTTDSQKVPRELKRFMNYHRLTWNILSKNPKVRLVPKWRVELIAWIFVCWEWKKQMNTLISDWQKLCAISNHRSSQNGHTNKNNVGPSLGEIVDHYINERWQERDPNKEGMNEDQEERSAWKNLKEYLSRYDVSMDGIQAFQQFRLHCIPKHLLWPIAEQ
eukprot:Gb_05696 [translate_table: standard]